MGAGDQRPDRRRSARECGRASKHRLSGRGLDRQGPTMPRRCRQAGAQSVELVVETLLGDLAVSDQATPMTDRGA